MHTSQGGSETCSSGSRTYRGSTSPKRHARPARPLLCSALLAQSCRKLPTQHQLNIRLKTESSLTPVVYAQNVVFQSLCQVSGEGEPVRLKAGGPVAVKVENGGPAAGQGGVEDVCAEGRIQVVVKFLQGLRLDRKRQELCGA